MMARIRSLAAALLGAHPSASARTGAPPDERMRAEERLREISAETRAILQTASDAIVTGTPEGRIEGFNPSAERMFGYAAEEAIGLNVSILTLDPGQPGHSEALERYLMTREIPTINEIHPGVGLRKDGSTFPISVTLSDSTVGGKRRITGFIRDLTREKALELRLRAAATEAVLAEQRERRVLASDLHDGLGQLLSLASMKLGALRSAFEGQELGSRVREIEEVIGEADRRTTSLTFQLSPPVLEDVGLVAAAQWLAEDVERRYDLQVIVEHDTGPLPLDEGTRIVATAFLADRD